MRWFSLLLFYYPLLLKLNEQACLELAIAKLINLSGTFRISLLFKKHTEWKKKKRYVFFFPFYKAFEYYVLYLK